MFTKKQKHLFLIAILFVFLSACKKKYEDNYFNGYFPLEVGNTWIYQYRYFVPDDQNNWSDSATITTQIIKDTLLDQNLIGYIVESTRSGSTTISRNLWYLKDGKLIGDNYQSAYRNAQIIYPNEFEVGMTWQLYPNNPNPSAYSTKTVTKEFPNYGLLNQNVQAFLIVSGDSIGNGTGYERTEEVYAPYIGRISSMIYSRIYGRIHIQETKLINYFKI